MFPNLPNGPADLPGLGKLFLFVGTTFAAVTLLLGGSVKFFAIHFADILLMAGALAFFGLIFIFIRSEKGL